MYNNKIIQTIVCRQFNFIDLFQYVFIMLNTETINGRSNMAYKYDGKYILDGSRKLYEFDGKYIKKYCGGKLYEFDGKYVKKYCGNKLYELTGRDIKKYCGTRIAQYKDLGEAFIKVLALEGLL